MNLIPIASKILGESLLSLYPIFVKKIDLSLTVQMWSRFFSYILVALAFINWTFVSETLFTTDGILLSGITIAHIYTSYRGFLLLDSGVSYSIFYLYPLMILLMSGVPIHPIMILSIIGVILLAFNNDLSKVPDKNTKEKAKDTLKDPPKEFVPYEGVLIIALAAFTEALIYFVVRRIKTPNPWNHLFISYFFGAILMSFLFSDKIREAFIPKKDMGQSIWGITNISWSLLINILIGLFGYLLRFFSMPLLGPTLYANLSYIGILMAYIYGVLFNGEIVSLQKILGSLCILIPNFYLR